MRAPPAECRFMLPFSPPVPQNFTVVTTLTRLRGGPGVVEIFL